MRLRIIIKELSVDKENRVQSKIVLIFYYELSLVKKTQKQNVYLPFSSRSRFWSLKKGENFISRDTS